MKKIILVAIAAILSATAVSAQDMAEATSTAQAANEALSTGDLVKALEGFEAALTMAELCGGEGIDLVNTCKDVIPTIMLSIGKDYIKAEKYSDAISFLTKTATRAKELENTNVLKDASDLIPQIYTQEANIFMKSKNFTGALSNYKKAMEHDPKNGRTALMLAMAHQSLGQYSDAEAAFKIAAENGQGTQALKRLSNMFLKLAQTSLKTGKFQQAMDYALKSNESVKSANAFKLAASAAMKLQETSKAIGYYEEYLGISPNAKDKNDIIYTIAALSQKSGDKAKAKEFYSKLLSDPKYGTAVKALIEAL